MGGHHTVGAHRRPYKRGGYGYHWGPDHVPSRPMPHVLGSTLTQEEASPCPGAEAGGRRERLEFEGSGASSSSSGSP